MNHRALFSTCWSLLFAMSAISCVTCRTVCADPPPDRRVEVHVTVTVPQGVASPENFPVKLSGAQRLFGAGLNAQGVTTVVGTFPADTTVVWITLDPNQPLPPTEQASLRPIWRAAQVDANKRFSLPPSRKVELVPGQEHYRMTIELPVAIAVSGTLKRSAGTPIRSAIIERQGLVQVRCYSGQDGTFEIYGVPKGLASFVFIELPGQTAEVWPIWLTSTQTANDHSVGELTLDASQHTATLDVQISGTETMPKNEELKADAVCFVRASDQRVFQFLIDASRKVRGDTSLPKISAGEYFVLPGHVATSTDVLKLLRLLRNGRRADVEDAGLTVLDIPAGSTVQRTINTATESSKISTITE